ncbi:MAG: hypothetical protein GXY47_15625 [Acidobacteria bacterium]|nr:hypothetical protein [Acidobacteriota bacterium]
MKGKGIPAPLKHVFFTALSMVVLSTVCLGQSGREAPLVLDFQQGIKAELTGLVFVDEVRDGTRWMRINADKKDKYRLGIATLRISKPAGTRLTLACADVTLHYYHGENNEVAPCEGLSSFVSSADSDRDISLSTTNGPGFLKKQTSVRATEATTVYIDVLFGYMEQDVGGAWVAIGQVCDREKGFASSGWKP